jgi:hypothetical protein
MVALLIAAALAAGPNVAELRSEAQEAVVRCFGRAEQTACFTATQQRCVRALSKAVPAEPMMEAYCIELRNQSMEVRLRLAESKLEARFNGDSRSLSAAVAANRDWDQLTHSWCDVESWSAPRAVTGDLDLAKATCRSDLLEERATRLYQALGWLDQK